MRAWGGEEKVSIHAGALLSQRACDLPTPPSNVGRSTSQNVIMPTLDDVSRLASRFPGSEEKAAGGHLAWLVRRKPFAWESVPWPSEGEHIRALVSSEPCLGVSVSDEDDKRALLQGWPSVFAASETKWGGPKIIIRLDAVDPDHFVELVTESWRLNAPKYLRDEFDRRV